MTPIYGYNDKEITRSELTAMAYDTNTPDELAEHYKKTLKVAECSVRDWDIEWSRIIFLINPNTRKVRMWFD